MIVVEGHDGNVRRSTVLEPTLFPDGTSQVWKVPPWVLRPDDDLTVTWHFEAERELMDLLSFAELKGAHKIDLVMPYLPYARQDKKVDNGQTFNLRVFLKVLRVTGFRSIAAESPHSTHLLEGVVSVRERAFRGIDARDRDLVVVYPDSSAYERYRNNVELADKPYSEDI